GHNQRSLTIYITIEGNIGAGKTTILSELAKELGFKYQPEGIESDPEFQRLVKSIGDGEESAGERLNAYLAKKRSATIKGFKPDENYVMERSVTSAMLFAMADGSSDATLDKIYRHIIDTPQPYLSIYLRTPAPECMKRIKKRNRSGEQTLPMRYLRKVEKVHDEWAEVGEEVHRVLVIEDGEMNVPQMAELVRAKLETVQNYGTLYERRKKFHNV
ncbi:hypothetical protein EHW61_15725, partial [Salinivibrio sp. VYel6]|uniref:deoxynucleoside kinase n=1 Tax=Salinivibrio sp. VYel6 TaxID=2490493 RepID=UPI00128DF699